VEIAATVGAAAPGSKLAEGRAAATDTEPAVEASPASEVAGVAATPALLVAAASVATAPPAVLLLGVGGAAPRCSTAS